MPYCYLAGRLLSRYSSILLRRPRGWVAVLLLLLGAHSAWAQAPAWVWHRLHVGGSNGSTNDVAVDAVGYVYTVGSFNGRLELGAHSLTGSGDGYLVKYDAQGNVVWSRAQTGAGYQNAGGVVTDARGFVYVRGIFSGATSIGGQVLTSVGGYDVYLAKYDPQGNLLWARSGGSTGDDVLDDLAVAPDGSVYITGKITAGATFGSVQLQCQGAEDAYLVKYSDTGQVQWGVRGGVALGKIQGQGVAVDQLGNVTLLGHYDRPFTFSGVAFPTASRGNAGALFLLQYSPSGTLLWSQYVAPGSSQFASGYDLTADSNNNLIILGQAASYGTIMFGPVPLTATNNGSVFVAKCSAAGVFQWVQSTGDNMYNNGHKLALDAANNVYITGSMYTYLAVGPYVLNTTGFDTFLAKYSAAGVAQWALSPRCSTGLDDGLGLAIDAGGNVYMSGSIYTNTSTPAVFGPYTFPAHVGYRGWLVRLGTACTPPAQPVISSTGPVCAGAPLTLSATGVPAGSAYLWSGPRGFTSTQPTVQVTADTTLSGTFTLSISSACPVTSAPLTVVVKPRPATPTISQNGATLSSSATTGNQWYLNGQPIGGATGSTYLPTATGSYTVVTTSGNGCASAPSAPAPVVLAARGAAPGTSLRVYPNPVPTGSRLHLALSGYHTGAEVRLLDGLGRVVARQQASAAARSTEQLNVAGLPAGLYVLQVRTAAGVDTRRVVLQ